MAKRYGSGEAQREAIQGLALIQQEHSHIHLIDAKTFNSHVVVPVPFDACATSPASSAPASTHRGPSLRHPTSPAVSAANARRDMCGQSWGIAGVAFDPTGDWLYSGTESTVVEWDLRRLGGGQGGTWGMA